MAHIHRLTLIAILFIASLLNAPVSNAAVPQESLNGWCVQGRYEPCAATAELTCKALVGDNYRHVDIAADGKSGRCYNRSMNFVGLVAPATYQSCPANSTKVNDECICSAGHIEEDNQCKPGKTDEEELEEECRNRSGNSRDSVVTQTGRGEAGPNTDISSVCHIPEAYDPGGGQSGIPMFPGTDKGCAASFEYSWSGRSGDDWNVYGRETYTGGTCTPGNGGEGGGEGTGDGEPEAKDPPKCEGQQGTVNGVQVCLPYDSTQGTDGTSKTNNPDGSSSETTSTTECKGNKCTTTTTTTNRDSNGNSTGTSTKTDTTTKDVYCQKNPAAGACKGNGTTGGGSGKGDGQEGDDSEWGGSCDAGWTCEGDAIQCAIAKRQHEDSCEMKKETQESKLYGQSKDKTGKVTGDLEGNETRDFSGSLNTSARFSASSCIQDLTVVVANKTVTLPFSKICPHLANIGYVLLVVAGVIAVVIVMRGR